jgi:hypothetical protein
LSRTVEEILRQSGLTDDQIKALDAKVLSGFTTVLSSATDAQQAAARDKEAAELAQRAQQELYANQITPALDSWAIESANLKAERDYYRTQNENARAGGFIPKEAPSYSPNPNPNPPQGPDGRFVAGANPVPGSPSYMTFDQGITALTNATWAMNEYQRLFGTVMPEDVGVLLKESAERHMSFRDHVSTKFGFEKKRQEIAETKQKAHDEAVAKAAIAENDKKWAERVGSNPNLRAPEDSRFSAVRKATDAGTRPDPLTMSKEQRRNFTRTQIHKEIAENETAAAS